MSNIKEILQLHWMDAAKMAGGSYVNEPSLSADQSLAEIKRIIDKAKPEIETHDDFSTMAAHGYYSAIEKHLDDYRNNLLKALGE